MSDGPTVTFSVKVDADEGIAWVRAAQRMGVDVIEWMRRACNAGPGVLDVRRDGQRDGPSDHR